MNLVEIIALRKQYKISQIKLAEASGFSPATISSWELNKSTPSERELTRLEGTLNSKLGTLTPMSKIFARKESRNREKLTERFQVRLVQKANIGNCFPLAKPMLQRLMLSN
jgi:transcriptional regulator with XRE-family HTH domain